MEGLIFNASCLTIQYLSWRLLAFLHLVSVVKANVSWLWKYPIMECLPTLYQQHICFGNADTSASATFGVKSIGTRHNKRSLSFGIYQSVVCAINKSYLLLALCGFLDVGCHLTSVMSEFNEKMRWYWRLLERTLINSLPACMYDKQSWAETDKTIHVLILKGGLHKR